MLSGDVSVSRNEVAGSGRETSEKHGKMGKRSRMLTAAGILNVVAGAFGIYAGIDFDPLAFLLFFYKLVILSGFEPLLLAKVSHALTGGPILPLEAIRSLYIAFGGVAIAGGICDFKRKLWGLSLAGSICSILCKVPLGIIALVFTSVRKRDFS